MLMVIFATVCQRCLFNSHVGKWYWVLGGKPESGCDKRMTKRKRLVVGEKGCSSLSLLAAISF